MHNPMGGRDAPDVSQAAAEQLRHFMLQCSDILIELDVEGRVLAARVTADAPHTPVHSWPGKRLKTLLSPDSAPKFPQLMRENAASPRSQARWRHLNFVMDDGAVLPLLLKYFETRADTAYAPMRLLCARDLRPAMEEQQAFQRELLRQETIRLQRTPNGHITEW